VWHDRNEEVEKGSVPTSKRGECPQGPKKEGAERGMSGTRQVKEGSVPTSKSGISGVRKEKMGSVPKIWMGNVLKYRGGG
jgi:hypothetical protein